MALSVGYRATGIFGTLLSLCCFFFGLRAGGLLMQGRITYAIDLMLFIVRILEIFYVDRTLGPYVVMIGKMVSSANISTYLLSKIDT